MPVEIERGADAETRGDCDGSVACEGQRFEHVVILTAPWIRIAERALAVHALALNRHIVPGKEDGVPSAGIGEVEV